MSNLELVFLNTSTNQIWLKTALWNFGTNFAKERCFGARCGEKVIVGQYKTSYQTLGDGGS